jgi:haloacetate dehalogenase
MTFAAGASQSENLFQARLIKMSRSPHLFEGFSPLDSQTSRVRFAGVTGGEGPPLLLLHGYPESHATWHDVAPALAKRYTVVAPDLPGYGKSRILDAGPWNKRAVGAELVEMMRSFGHDRFGVVGHDRGARVGYRLALDHPDRVSAYCSLAVVPTLDVWPAVDRQFAKGAFHWFLFLQSGDLPERMLAADPDAFLEATLNQMAGGIEKLHPAAVAAYREAFREASVRQAMIEDYRSAYDTDLDHDAADRAAGRKIACPVMVLWANERLVAGGMETGTLTAVDVWRRWADDVSGFDISCGHLLPEQAPEAVIEKIVPFLDASLKRDTA